jgi:hypothetical protein
MRRFVKLSLLGLAAGAGACSTPDLVHPTEVLPYAGVRFINAVPDTGGAFGLDFRFVDLLESNAHYQIKFRNNPSSNTAPATDYSNQIQFKGAREGTARHFKIFLDDTLQSVAQLTLKDSTLSIVKGHNYTAMLWGTSRNPGATMKLDFWEDSATVNAGKVKMRVINTTSGALDVWAFPTGGTVPATATWAAVPPYSKSLYVEVDTGAYQYRVRNAGAGTNLFADRAAAPGAIPTCSGVSPCPTGAFPDIEGIPGTRLSGSAISGIVFPPSVNPSKAAQFANPAIVFAWDKRPARSCDPYC